MRAMHCAPCLVGLAVLVAACGPASGADQESDGLDLGSAPWQDGSTARYLWLDQGGNEIGTSHFSFSLQGDAWVVTETDQIGGLEQTMEMQINATTLEPVGEHKHIRTPDTEVELTTRYQDGTLDIEAVVDGQSRTASVDVPPNAIDNDQLLMTLRALPFAEGYQTEYVVVVAQNALKVPMTIVVQGEEQVEVPAGSFQTWRVALQMSQGSQSAWYQADAPHVLVQYDNGTTRMVLAREE